MKYLKCAACGKAQPVMTHCIYCGEKAGNEQVEEVAVHPNAAARLQEAEQAVRDGEFKKALELTSELTAQLPDSATVFWLRLLAGNRCKNAGDLIIHGVSEETDPDFASAAAHAKGLELASLRQVAETSKAIQKKLIEALRRTEYKALRKANVYALRDEAQMRTEACKKEIFACWEKLRRAEDELCALDLNGTLLVYSERDAVNTANRKIQQEKSALSPGGGLSEKDAAALDFRLGALLYQSENAEAQVKAMEDSHPWTAKQRTLTEQRDRAAENCRDALARLEALNREIAERTNRIADKNNTFHEAILFAEGMRFFPGCTALGVDAFQEVLASAGIAGGCVIHGKKEGEA